MIKVCDVTEKNWKNYFCVIEENIAYIERVIQSSMFYSFYLFLSILFGNVDSALISDLNAYVWMLMLYSNVGIIFKCSNLYYIWRFKSSNDMLSMKWLRWCRSWYSRNWKVESGTPVLDGIERVWKSNWQYLLFKDIIFFYKEISLLLLLCFLNPKISFFIGKGCVFVLSVT